MTPPAAVDRIRIVLCSTSNGGNLGAVARAMHTTGFHDLALVTPYGDPLGAEARQRASGSDAILERARVVDTLDAAVADCTLLVGASARPRKSTVEALDVRRAAERIVSAPDAQIAVLFGCERSGLTNEELGRCHLRLFIPANPDYSSLNLSAAVQVVVHELHMAQLAQAGVQPDSGDRDPDPPASDGALQHCLGVLREAWEATGFIDPTSPAHAVSAQRLEAFYRLARPSEAEVGLLRTAAIRTLQKVRAQAGDGANPRDGDPA